MTAYRAEVLENGTVELIGNERTTLAFGVDPTSDIGRKAGLCEKVEGGRWRALDVMETRAMMDAHKNAGQPDPIPYYGGDTLDDLRRRVIVHHLGGDASKVMSREKWADQFGKVNRK